MDYETIIGLEVHAQLLTQSKLFCSCSTQFGNEPNYQTCQICLGMPGVLPVLNQTAVEYAIKAGLALHCTINKKSEWARKNYFYPDLPKGYQISQYQYPICEHGYLDIHVGDNKKKIGITRIHIEEDAGKNIHIEGEDISLVDFNRSSVPLIEIVSQPDLRSPEEAVAYLQALRNILMYLEVCDGNMQEGSFRCDANVSIRPKGSEKFGTRTEIKNVNSFRFVAKAIDYEVARHKEVMESGKKVLQETRLFDSITGKTRSMRSKEDAHDYRYFPDPDLPLLIIDDNTITKIKNTLPELPEEKSERFVRDYGITAYDAHVLVGDKALAHYYEQSLQTYEKNPKSTCNWIMTEVMREIKEDECGISGFRISAEALAELISLIDSGFISGKIAKDVFSIALEKGGNPKDIVQQLGGGQISDIAFIEEIVKNIITSNTSNVQKYREGKKNVLGFLVGLAMKETQGKANPKLVNELLLKYLEK